MLKNNKVKLLILIFISVLLGGCSTEYDAIFYSNNKVGEKIQLYIPNKKMGETKKQVKNNINEQIEAYKKIKAYSNYNFKRKIGSETSKVTIKNTHPSLVSFSNSTFAKGLFENITVIENNEFTIFQTVGNYYYDYLFGAESEIVNEPKTRTIDDVVVKIKIQNKLIESNADEVDEKNNIYTWNFTPDDKVKGIYLKYGTEKRYDVIIKTIIENNIVLLIILGSIIGLSLLVVIIAKTQRKLINRI